MPFRQSEDRKWKRPYPIGWFHALVGLFGVLGVVFFVALVVSGITRVGTRPGAAALELAIGLAFFGVWFTFCWRLLTVGIYVGNRGLQYRGAIKTTTIPWDDVRGVRVGPLNRAGLYGLTGTVTIWIDRRSGESFQTWVNNNSADFLGRRKAFDSAFGDLDRSVREHLQA
jgi:hypothetical protein